MKRGQCAVWMALVMVLTLVSAWAGSQPPAPYSKMTVLWQKGADTSDWLSVYTWTNGSAPVSYCVPLDLRTSTWQRTSVAIGDADGDRQKEIWFTEQEQGTHNDRITAYTWAGPGQGLVQVFQSDVDASDWDNVSITIGDADNDGHPDIFTVQLGAVGTVSNADRFAAFTWAGPGHSLVWNTYMGQDSGNNGWSGWNHESVSIGDADNDGTNEVVAVANSGNSDVMRFYRWAGPGHELASYDSDRNVDMSSSWNKIALSVGDANNDGANEIVTVWREIQSDPRDDELNIYRWAGPGHEPVEIQHAVIGSYDDAVNELAVAVGNLDNYRPSGTIISVK